MALFGISKKKKEEPSQAFIEMERVKNMEDLPRDARLLYKTCIVYWNMCKSDKSSEKLPYQKQAIRAAYALYRFGLENQYPRAGYYIARYCCMYGNDLDGMVIDSKRCAAHMCGTILLTAKQITEMQEAIFVYLYFYPDGLDRVIQWLRQRVERDKEQKSEPFGLIMLRHYLVLRTFMNSEEMRGHLNQPYYYELLWHRYALKEAYLQCISCQLWRNEIDGREHTSEEARSWLRVQSYKGDAMASQIIYGISFDRIAYQYEGSKTYPDGTLVKNGGFYYSSYYENWNKALVGLRQEQEALGQGWYEAEKNKAEWQVDQYVHAQIQRQLACEAYARSLYLYACGRNDEAQTQAALVERYDKSFIGSEAGNLWKEATVLAGQLHDNPNDEGVRRLARLIRQETPYWEPLVELSQEIRQDLLRRNGEEELTWYVMDEPASDQLDIAEGLILDPKVNGGKESRIRAGWLVKLNYYYAIKDPCLKDAIYYVNRYFDCPQLLQGKGVNIRKLTSLAEQLDENALYILGQLYMDFPAVHHGNSLIMTVGQIFYRELSAIYQKQAREIKASKDDIRLIEHLRKWYILEHEARREPDAKLVDSICIDGIRKHDLFFAADILRPGVFQYFMEREGRLWIKVYLKHVIDAGCTEVKELYNKMNAEDEEKERQWMREREWERKAQAARDEADRKRRHEEFNRRMDEAERNWDLIQGGLGRTNEEKAWTGEKTLGEQMNDKALRDFLENIGW